MDICLSLGTKTHVINRGLVISKIHPCPSRTVNVFGRGEKDLKMGIFLVFSLCLSRRAGMSSLMD